MALGAVGLQTHIWNNNLKSVLLLLGYPFLLLLMIFLTFAGSVWAEGMQNPSTSLSGWEAGVYGVVRFGHYALLVAAVWFGIAWMFHQNMINASTGARPVERREQPELYNLLENLCISRGITMPKLYIIDSPALNAYASGLSEKSYAITVTSGLLATLNRHEVEAVLGHELTHIINRDVRLLIIGVIFAGMISFFAELFWRSVQFNLGRRGKNGGAIFLVAAVVLAIGAFFAFVIRMAISRKREFLADAGAVELTRNPDAMVSALRKISGHAELEAPAEVQQMFIENPPAFSGLFSTHPPIEARINALVRFAGAYDVPSSEESFTHYADRATPAAPSAASPSGRKSPWGFGGPWGKR